MTDSLTPVQIEYRRRRSRVAKFVILWTLVPFALEVVFVYASAPSLLASIGLAACFAGILVSIVYAGRVWRCPACGITLWSGGVGTRGGKCLGCHTQLVVSRRSLRR
jgi:hypothetical protein